MAKIDFRTYGKLDNALSAKLLEAWRPQLVAAYTAIEAAVDSGDFATAYELAHKLDCSGLGSEHREYIKYVGLACINFGAAMAHGDSETYTSQYGHEALLNRTADTFALALEHNATLQTVKAAVQSVAEAEQEYREAHKAEDTPRYLKPLTSFADPSEKMIQLVSSLHTSRLSTWGFTAEAEILGYEYYELSAVLDNRTSAFCRMISGKKFKVEDARKTIELVLSLQSPDDAKNIQPWPTQTKDAIADYKKLSAEELTAKNLHIPPFHPHCRTILVKSGRAPRLAKPQVPEQDQVMEPYKATKDSFAELNLTFTDKAVQHWNDYVGLDPVSVLSKLSGENPLNVLDAAQQSTTRAIVVASDGDIKFNLKGILGAQNAKYAASVTLDPYTGTMYAQSLTFKNANAQRAAEFMKTFYSGMLDVGKSVGASEIVVEAGGETGVYLHAHAGFLPSKGAWTDLAKQLQADIVVDGKYEEAFATMLPEQQALVTKLLDTEDPQALYVLANLPFDAEGSTIGRLLLKNAQMEMVLNMESQGAMTKAAKVFK